MKKEVKKKSLSTEQILMIIISLVVVAFLIFIFLKDISPNIDGRAMVAPPQIHIRNSGVSCGDGTCSSSESYYTCPEDCCGEKGMQVESKGDCCPGLKAVQDVCEETVTPAQPASPTGDAIATPPQITPEMCWFCVDCGNKKCENHENSANCPEDCKIICGNGVCDAGETYQNCPIDCCASEGAFVSSPTQCCPGLKGVSPCYPGIPCLAFGWICINCGDNFCKEPENSFNCPEDCGAICGNKLCEEDENYLNCPQDCVPVCGNAVCEQPIETYVNCNADCCAPASSAVTPPYNCCPGLKLVDFVPPKGGIPISVKYCVDCGNHLCEKYENIENCPEDCEPEIDCETLPPISSSIEYIEGPRGEGSVVLNWRYAEIMLVKEQYIESALRCRTVEEQQEPMCNWPMIPPGSIDPNLRIWAEDITNIAQKLKFYRIRATVEVGCKPICLFDDSDSEGWYDSCTGELIKYAECTGMQAICDEIGSKSEGWYAKKIEPVGTAEGELIIWTQCSKQVKECPMKSDIMLVFGQKIVAKGPKEGGPETNINFLINLLGQGTESNELLAKAGADYVAKWDCSTQRFIGTAMGVGGRGVYTGVFNMDQGYPYSVSATVPEPGKRLIWTSKLPDHLTFSFCNEDNYLSLPVDTRLETALDLCYSLGIQRTPQQLGYWDFAAQEPKHYGCDEIEDLPGINFDVEPGGVYFINLNKGKSWTQE